MPTTLPQIALCLLVLAWVGAWIAPIGADDAAWVGQVRSWPAPRFGDDAVGQAAQRVADALVQADRRLDQWPETGDGWRGFLQLDRLRDTVSQLQQAGPEAVEPDTLDELLAPWTWSTPGIETPEFVAVRRALAELRASHRRAIEPDQPMQWAERTALLADGLLALQAHPADSAARRQVAEQLEWLRLRSPDSPQVAMVEERFARPNLHARIREDLLNARLAEPFSDQRQVVDCIKTTRIVSQGTSEGATRFKVEPDAQAARLRLEIAGQTVSRNVGFDGPIRVFSRSRIPFLAVTQAVLTAEGARFEPVEVSVGGTNTHIDRVESEFAGVMDHLARHVAERRIDQQRDEYEAISRAKARARYMRQFTEQLDEQREAGAQAGRELLAPLADRGLMPRDVRFASTDAHVVTAARVARVSQLAATSGPIAWPGGSALEVVLHESAVENTAASTASGRRIEPSQVVRELFPWFGEFQRVLGNSAPEDGDELSAVTFVEQRPVAVDFRENRLVVALRFRSFESGQRRYTAMDLTATYRPERSPKGWFLVREELTAYPPEYDPVTNPQLGVRTKIQQRVLLRRFERLLDERIDLNRPLCWTDDTGDIRAVLFIDHLATAEGWLALGFRFEEPKSARKAPSPDGVAGAKR